MFFFFYLINLLVDYLKIDGMFIKNIERDFVFEKIVESIYCIVKIMNLIVIVEFVEIEFIFNKVIDLGIDYG